MKIAIKGHESRGKEVIQILESLGGKNKWFHYGNNENCFYELHDDCIWCATTRSEYFKYYTLEEFEKKFPFKVGDEVTIAGLPYFPKVITQMTWDCDEILYSFEGLNNTWFGAKALKKFEMKEKRNITLTLDKAKEWYKKGGELKEIALQAYSKEELTKVELPKSFKEFCKNYPVRKGEAWFGIQDGIYVCGNDSQTRYYKNWTPSKKSAEAHLAMMQLEQLRNCWRQGWKPDWNNATQTKYCICCYRGEFKISTLYKTRRFLSFPTYEMAEEFLKCFKDLIEKAGDLI